MMSTDLTDLLDIRRPILLAPMGGVAGGVLAAAVSDAGGLGLIGGGYADPVALAHELAAAGKARIGVGFITFALEQRRSSLDIALDHGLVAVQLSFGDPSPYAEQIHAAGALLISQVQSVGEARRAMDAGADVIIAQGQDSGGHGRSGRGTIGLVPAIVDAVGPIPVVAAGGIADGRGLAAALMLGGAGVSLGTRLFASVEAIADPAAQRLIAASSGDDTVRTEIYDVVRGPAWPAGLDGRVLTNAFVQRWRRDLDGESLQALELDYRRADEDDYTVKELWAGEGIDLIDGVQPAATIIADIVAQAARCLTAGQSLLDR
ncbi:MAG: nitronate monooxygenase [Ilumatobacteraceae bacterium]